METDTNEKFTHHKKKDLKKQNKIIIKNENQINKSKKRKIKKLIYLAAAIIIILLIVFLINLILTKEQNEDSSKTQNNGIFDINLREHTNLAMHIHPTIEIEILGDDFNIPENIGISKNGMKVMHTHDTSGKIHVESPYPNQFYLKDFFTIWGKNFDSNCIFEYCKNNNNELNVFVNGIKSDLYGDLPLNDGDMIKIVYSSA